MIHDEDREKGPELYNYRPPALSYACRNSRRAILKGLDAYANRFKDRTLIYKPFNDTVQLLKVTDDPSYKAFAKKEYKSIATPYKEPLSGADAKAIVGLERIVLVLGSQIGACEMTLEKIPEQQWTNGRNELLELRICARKLKVDLEEQSKKWKTYQKRRVKQGKSSPDRNVPTIEVAYPTPICEALSPYSY